MVKVAVAGYVETVAGLRLQIPVPTLELQLKASEPAKPSCVMIEIGAFGPALPAFTTGNDAACRLKVGFEVTTRVNDVLKGAGAPTVIACNVTV